MFSFEPSRAPASAGVYIFRDAVAKVLYVGKANVLRERIRYYFLPPERQFGKTRALMQRAQGVEFISTNSGHEALVLENALIKQHRPEFNSDLKDSHRYTYLVVTGEEFPRLLTVRKPPEGPKAGGKVFGPFTSGISRGNFVRFAQKTFKIRTCQTLPRQPCLQYYLGYCSGPCAGLVSKEDYARDVRRAVDLLEGRGGEIIREMEGEMRASSGRMEFEKALSLRNKIEAVGRVSQRQVVERHVASNEDVIGIARKGGKFFVNVFSITRGAIAQRQAYALDAVEPSGMLSQFISGYYAERLVPDLIIVRERPDDSDSLEKFLEETKKGRVRIAVPEKGGKMELLELAERNAALLAGEADTPNDVLALQRALKLDSPPNAIECFDISTLSGSFTVGSMVRFENGKARKSRYRKFKVKTAGEKPDDFASIGEIVFRRFAGTLAGQMPGPDLIVIDGGPGQLSAALDALVLAGADIPCIALAKRLEEIYSPNALAPLRLPHSHPGLKLLQRARNEAHRFAITYHRKLRGKGMTAPKQDEELARIGNKRDAAPFGKRTASEKEPQPQEPELPFNY